MICFRDMRFCDPPWCGEPDCDRRLTDDVKAAARRWWGKDGAPIDVGPCMAPRPTSRKERGMTEAEAAAEIEALRSQLAETEAARLFLDERLSEARGLLKECSDDLSAEIHARAPGELPRRIKRDLEIVELARAFLNHHRSDG